MIGLLIPVDVFTARDHQAQGGSADRLGRGGVLPMGGRAANLGASRDKRHLLCVFHDRVTWSRNSIVAPVRGLLHPPFGGSGCKGA